MLSFSSKADITELACEVLIASFSRNKVFSEEVFDAVMDSKVQNIFNLQLNLTASLVKGILKLFTAFSEEDKFAKKLCEYGVSELCQAKFFHSKLEIKYFSLALLLNLILSGIDLQLNQTFLVKLAKNIGEWSRNVDLLALKLSYEVAQIQETTQIKCWIGELLKKVSQNFQGMLTQEKLIFVSLLVLLIEKSYAEHSPEWVFDAFDTTQMDKVLDYFIEEDKNAELQAKISLLLELAGEELDSFA